MNDILREKYFNEEVGRAAFVFLSNLQRFNLDSRSYMANAIYNAVYVPVEKRSGEFADIDENSRTQLLDLATLDILAKVFMAIEDLGKILLTTGKPLKDIPATMLDAGQNDSLSAITKYSAKPEQELLRVFPFRHPREDALEGADESAVLTYTFAQATVLKKTLVFTADFVRRHVWAYNKYKHGLSIILGIRGEQLGPGFDGTIPIFTTASELSSVKVILVGRTVVDKLTGFLASIVKTSKMLVERKLQIAEFGGTPPLLLCRVTNSTPKDALFEPYSLGNCENCDEATLIAAFRRTIGALKRIPIEASLVVDGDRTKIEDLLNFYNVDWRIA